MNIKVRRSQHELLRWRLLTDDEQVCRFRSKQAAESFARHWKSYNWNKGKNE